MQQGSGNVKFLKFEFSLSCWNTYRSDSATNSKQLTTKQLWCNDLVCER